MCLMISSAIEGTQLSIHVAVKVNGRVQPTPRRVVLIVDGRQVASTVKNSSFQVPANALSAKKLDIVTTVNGKPIRLSDLPHRVLEYENWTIVLADSSYGDDYDWALPKHVDVRSSCLLVLDSTHKDPGAVIFQPHCRNSH